MREKIFRVLENNFDWMKKDFTLMVFLIVVSFFLFRVVNLHLTIQTIIIVLLFGKSILFSSTYSILPSMIQGKDQFSWKFLQGLPLNKKELIFSLTCSNFLCRVPFFLLMIFFWPQINRDLFQSTASFSLLFVDIILAIILMSLLIVRALIEFPRLEFQRKNANNNLVLFLSRFLVSICVLAYLAIGLDYLERILKFDLVFGIVKIFKFLEFIAFSWWLVPVLIVTIIWKYFNVLDVWTNEKKSYRSNAFNPKKEFSLILSSLALLFFAYTNQAWYAPELYQRSLMNAVYLNDYKAIEDELKIHPNVNQQNSFGVTAMMVAIKEGNFPMVKFLESKGASYSGKITSKKDPRYGFDALLLAIDSHNSKMLEHVASKNFNLNQYNELAGIYPLHLAVYYCNSKMVDFLLQKGSDVNALDRSGQTPLIVSSKRSCYSSAVILKEAEANFNLVDKKGKNALMKLRKSEYNKEFQYFLEKNTRAPASSEAR